MVPLGDEVKDSSLPFAAARVADDPVKEVKAGWEIDKIKKYLCENKK